jgi:uncharacterized protein
MKKSWIRAAVIITFFFGIIVYAGARDLWGQEGKSFFWKVEQKGPTVYILGSVHVLKKEQFSLNPIIEKAFEESDTLVVEAQIKDIALAYAEMMNEKGLYGENDALKDHVSPETYALAVKEGARIGLPVELMDKQKPWFLALSIQGLELLKAGYNPQFGIDHYFLTKAAGQKRILELEGLYHQINFLSGLPPEEQELMLLVTLSDLKTVIQETDHLVKAWGSGDTQGMEALIMKKFQEDKRLAFFYEKFLYERNKKMVAKIDYYLQTHGTYFVVVGAAHLIGNQGIVKLLQEKGYRVKQH